MQKKFLVKGLVVCLLFGALIWGKVLYMQRSHFRAAEQYYKKADWKLAMREYDYAMHAYSPWSPYIERSAERLWAIGEMFEKEDKPAWAVDAFSAIRSSFYGSRSLYTPGEKWIEKCTDKIAGLQVKLMIREGSVKPENSASEKAKLLYVMKVDRAPVPVWAALGEAGFLGWIVSVIFVIFRGFDDSGKLRLKQALYGAFLFVASFAVWVISMLKA